MDYRQQNYLFMSTIYCSPLRLSGSGSPPRSETDYELNKFIEAGLTKQYVKVENGRTTFGRIVTSEHLFSADSVHSENSILKKIMNMITGDQFTLTVPRGNTIDGKTWLRPWGDVIEVQPGEPIPPFSVEEIRKFVNLLMSGYKLKDFEDITSLWKEAKYEGDEYSCKLYITDKVSVYVDFPTPTVILSLIMTRNFFRIEIPTRVI